MNNIKVVKAIATKTVTVNFISKESYQKLVDLGYQIVFYPGYKKLSA